MAVSDLAIAAVGTDMADDYVLRPREHADSLPPEARSLAQVLRTPDIIEQISIYSEYDGAAIAAQSKYKLAGKTAVFLHTVSVICGGLYLLIQGLIALEGADTLLADRYGWFQEALGSLVIAQIVTLILAALLAMVITRQRYYDTWMSCRSRAETARINLFTLVAAAEEETSPTDGRLPLLPLQIEYFRRYQLDVQMDYYWQRGRDHNRSAGRLRGRRSFYAAIGSLVSAPLLLIFIGVAFRDQVELVTDYLIAFGGILSSALLSMNDRFRSMNNDAMNAARYENTFNNLKTLADEHLEALRDMADEEAPRTREQYLDFVRLVNRQVSTEHVQWRELSKTGMQPDWEGIIDEAVSKVRAG